MNADYIEQIEKVSSEWLGTPYHHQASIKGVGADCIGLIAGIFEEVGLPFEYPKNYPRGSAMDTMYAAIDNAACSVDVALNDVAAGDVIIVRIKENPQHFMLHLGGGKIIHADYAHGTCYDNLERWDGRIIRILRHKAFI